MILLRGYLIMHLLLRMVSILLVVSSVHTAAVTATNNDNDSNNGRLLRSKTTTTRRTTEDTDIFQSNIQDSLLLSPTLPLGDINVVVLTDVHSWVTGHGRHEPYYDANYGHVLSFYELLRTYFDDPSNHQDHPKSDLFFVMNGDFMDGTGLSTYPPEHLVPILQKMPWDALTIGNHELYKNSTITYITQPDGFVDFWDGRYLTSNVVMTSSPQNPIGDRYTFLRGKFSTVLAFGFLYNFQGNDPITTVQKVEDVVQAEWFINVLSNNKKNNGGGEEDDKNDNDFDAILVLAHMDVEDPLTSIILQAIRNICGDTMPIQFITGHSHYRGRVDLDTMSTSFEAGRYLDTVGFVSFPRIDTAMEAAAVSNNGRTSPLFQHVFLDANTEKLELALTGGDRKSFLPQGLSTPNGTALASLIQKTEEEMGLYQVIGCVPRTYHLEASMDKSDSLWGLYMKQVIANYDIFQNNEDYLFVQGTGAYRYDLFAGEVTLTDFISVSPFNDTIFVVAQDIEGSILLDAFAKYTEPNPFLENLPKYALSRHIDKKKKYTVVTAEYDLEFVLETLMSATGQTYDPIQQFYNTSRTNTGQTAVTTSSIWMDFLLESRGSCDEIDDDATSAEKAIISVVALIGGIICLALFIFFNRQSRGTKTEKEFDVIMTSKGRMLTEESESDSSKSIL